MQLDAISSTSKALEAAISAGASSTIQTSITKTAASQVELTNEMALAKLLSNSSLVKADQSIRQAFLNNLFFRQGIPESVRQLRNTVATSLLKSSEQGQRVSGSLMRLQVPAHAPMEVLVKHFSVETLVKSFTPTGANRLDATTSFILQEGSATTAPSQNSTRTDSLLSYPLGTHGAHSSSHISRAKSLHAGKHYPIDSDDSHRTFTDKSKKQDRQQKGLLQQLKELVARKLVDFAHALHQK